MSLTSKIKSKAYEIGFCSVGIARADALDKEATFLKEWLGRGYQGKMQYLENNFEKRCDPRELVPGAQSVISLALNYYNRGEHSADKKDCKISRYAWADDYHDVMKKKLWELFDYTQSLDKENTKEKKTSRKNSEKIEGRVFVDTAPIMDKAWAVRSGLGWQGKHSNVITREQGSWVFLGEIVLSCPLEYDEPIEDFCGSCTRCIEACPTDAIVEPYVVDATKCISYLTIELKAEHEIPEEFHDKLENWIFGCDICQDVCPWNQKFSQETQEESFFPREGIVQPQLKELEEISQDEFRRKFRRSPVKRPKWQGLLRNIRAVLSGLKKKNTTESFTD